MEGYYHASCLDYKIGDNVKDYYGTIIKDRRFYTFNDQNHSQYLREMIFEKVRLKSFPNLPSRLDSIYMCLNETDSISYAKQLNYIVYEVEFMESHGNILKADMSWIDYSLRKSYEELEDIAYKYFSGQSTDRPFWEFLFDGEVIAKRVIRGPF